MKRIVNLILVSALGGAMTLGSYKLLVEDDNTRSYQTNSQPTESFLPVSNTPNYGTNVDFTDAAEKTIHAVVHVKNVAVFKGGPRSIWEYNPYGTEGGRALQGAGSGVIITPDGYIVTNNHVIKGASEIEVTLNNNKTYTAEVIGSDPAFDIALIKVEPEEELDYIPFGDSDNAKIGEWVLAVGNPFNLKSTVTAGIVSAKARDLNVYDSSPQSFIQTDAAINPGNSGGALVNINGELIGINTAITSPSGSYIGYAFAVPSNNARKIVEDIMEYGDVQKGILGIRGGTLNEQISNDRNLNISQGVIVGAVTPGSGAEKSGIQEFDVIRKIDEIEIAKFSDLTGYINSKRPGDIVRVHLIRNGESKTVEIELTKLETYSLPTLGFEVANTTKEELKKYNAPNGVRISRMLTDDLPSSELIGGIISEINNKKVNSIGDVEQIMENRKKSNPIVITYHNLKGEKQRMIWR
ncbi:trypsin-like peptidase domain-containing protein [Christiangramia sp. OXR-203]|jgi:Do/DeqQ family serine protease|uniref:trypsin-like peptidase domain-containing protein n=1 Tax=Christiangramia sp. OXR-203 TaxID=3100176 RepID=UPI002AC91833|nr:trypsin-like peptidase domain-containing protein [Christiangramia sp. OXR-203]WPY97855.1 trypsin-like peptidase domain-containing protein [Christiangramia sp. OXR-203]